jgi:peptidyl-prolyl cis-trans isomerase C
VGEVIAEVGDSVLTAQELERRVPVHLNGRVTSDDRRRMVEAWVEEQLLYQDAVEKGMQEDLTVVRRVDRAIQMILTSELLERAFSNESTVTETDLQSYYAEHSDAFMRVVPELRVRQILIKGRSDATRVRKRLDSGAMFDQVAREESLDESSVRGGDVGYFTEDRVDPAFWAGCEKAKTGKLTQVRTPLGYHLIEVLDRKEAGSVRDLLDVRDEIRQRILNERRDALRTRMIEEIRNRIPASIYYDKLETAS